MQQGNEIRTKLDALLLATDNLPNSEKTFKNLEDEISKKSCNLETVKSELQTLSNYKSSGIKIDRLLSDLLEKATKFNHPLVIQELLQHGADPRSLVQFKGKDNKTITGTLVHMAVYSKSGECVEQIIKNLSDSDLKTLQIDNKTLGQFAYKKSSLAIIKILSQKFTTLFTEENNEGQNTLVMIIARIAQADKIDDTSKVILKIANDADINIAEYVDQQFTDKASADKIKTLIDNELTSRTFSRNSSATNLSPKPRKRKENDSSNTSNNNNMTDSSDDSSDEHPLDQTNFSNHQPNMQTPNKVTSKRRKFSPTISIDKLLAEQPWINDLLTKEHFDMCRKWPQSNINKYIQKGYYTFLFVFNPPEGKNDDAQLAWQASMKTFLKLCNIKEKNILLRSDEYSDKNNKKVLGKNYKIIDPNNQKKAGINYTNYDVIVYHNSTYTIAEIIRVIETKLREAALIKSVQNAPSHNSSSINNNNNFHVSKPAAAATESIQSSQPPNSKKRGRPPKNSKSKETENKKTNTESSNMKKTAKRGRPPKKSKAKQIEDNKSDTESTKPRQLTKRRKHKKPTEATPMVMLDESSEDSTSTSQPSTPIDTQKEYQPNSDDIQIDETTEGSTIPTVAEFNEPKDTPSEQNAISPSPDNALSNALNKEVDLPTPVSQPSISATGELSNTSQPAIMPTNTRNYDEDFSYISDDDERNARIQEAKKFDEEIAQLFLEKEQEEQRRAELEAEEKAQQAKLQQEAQTKKQLQQQLVEQHMKERKAMLEKLTQDRDQAAKERKEKESNVLKLKEESSKVSQSIGKLLQKVSASTKTTEQNEKTETPSST